MSRHGLKEYFFCAASLKQVLNGCIDESLGGTRSEGQSIKAFCPLSPIRMVSDTNAFNGGDTAKSETCCYRGHWISPNQRLINVLAGCFERIKFNFLEVPHKGLHGSETLSQVGTMIFFRFQVHPQIRSKPIGQVKTSGSPFSCTGLG